jgi:hypothetical protein
MGRTGTVSFIILITPAVVLCENGMKETIEGLNPLFTVNRRSRDQVSKRPGRHTVEAGPMPGVSWTSPDKNPIEVVLDSYSDFTRIRNCKVMSHPDA